MFPVRCFTLLVLLTNSLSAGAPPPAEAGGGNLSSARPSPPSAKPRENGCVPAGAAGFHGLIEGAVETIASAHHSFKLKVTRVIPSKENRASAPQSLVGAVVTVKRDHNKPIDGKVTPKAGHTEYIAGLKPGAIVQVSTRYFKMANSLKMNEAPTPPVPPPVTPPAPAVPSAPPSSAVAGK